ncbi:MAG: hypothetical protein AAGA67_14810 [Cyanobacteria bacterium P01_F01_bin.153]
MDTIFKESANEASSSVKPRSPGENRLLWIGSATLTGVVALVMLVAEGPSSSITPGESRGNGSEVVVPVQ